MVSREQITQSLAAINAAENARDLSPDEKSAVIDRLSASSVQGWANGVARGGRSEEREQEALLWTTFLDYHRTFEQIVLDPPFAAVRWYTTGSNDALDLVIGLSGSSIFRFDEAGKIAEFWMHYNG